MKSPELAASFEATPPPLHWAIYQDRIQLVELLLVSGAPLDQKDQDREATPLDYAVIYARREIIPILVANGANTLSGLTVAQKGAVGGFEEFSELPSRQDYLRMVELLQQYA